MIDMHSMYLNFFCFFELRIGIYVTFDYFRSETFAEITFHGKPISRCFAGINFRGQRENNKKKQSFNTFRGNKLSRKAKFCGNKLSQKKRKKQKKNGNLILDSNVL